MAFNLGQKRFSGFGKPIDVIKASNWVHAAAEMQNSSWATQIRIIAYRNINGMKKNVLWS